jgi:hypothetical protein
MELDSTIPIFAIAFALIPPSRGNRPAKHTKISDLSRFFLLSPQMTGAILPGTSDCRGRCGNRIGAKTANDPVVNACLKNPRVEEY